MPSRGRHVNAAGARGRWLALSREISYGCRKMPDRRLGADRGVGCDGDGRKVIARRGEVSRGRSTGAIEVRREGPNAQPSERTFVLVAVALTAANPFGGLVGKVRG